jgi:hypothetical protein
MKKNLIILLILCYSISSFATGESVIIKGNIKGIRGFVYAKKPVKILIIEDLITNTKKVIKSGFTDEFGNYELSVPIMKTQFAFIQFKKVERTLYIAPGKSYFINVVAPIQDLENSHGFFAKDVRKAMIKNKYPGEINYLIDSIENMSSRFLFNSAGGRRNYKVVKKFTDSLKIQFQSVNNSYFKQYVTYKTAELEMFVLRQFRKEFARRYFDNSKSLIEHIQCMHVFNAFFKGHMKNGIQTQDKAPFHSYILRGDLERMLTEVYKTTNYNRELNELILLKGLFEISNSYFYRKSRINITLDKIISSTNYPHHIIIANNIKKHLNHLASGYPAPPINLNYEEVDFNLKNYRGKYVYLCFFKTWNTSFEKEIEVINYLKKRYKEELEVVCIATDIERKSYNHFLAKQLDKEYFYYYNHNPKLLSDYRIKDFRVQKASISSERYFLIGPKGNVIIGEAKSPTQRFEYDFRKIILK